MKIKRILATVLCVCIAFGAAACDKTPETSKGETNVDFWSTYSTEKVLASRSTEKYEYTRLAAELDIDAALAEYEGAQLIMSAKTDVDSYDVELSDLKCGTNVYSKENIKVYNQKYIEVKSITNGQTSALDTGDYPDALLPFDAAKTAGENSVKAGKNQGIYFEFWIPADTVAGLYTGTFNILYDGKVKEIPVKLNVRNVKVSEVTHTKSYFSVDQGWGVAYGEMDSSVEVVHDYNRALSEYRLGGGQWPVGMTDYWIGHFGDNRQDIEDWVNLVWDYIVQPKNSTLALPYKFVTDSTGENIDEKILEDTIYAFAARCVEKKINLVDKLIGYFTMIDEPDMKGDSFNPHVKEVMDRVDAAIEAAAIRVENIAGADAAFKTEIADSVRNIETVVPVTRYVPELDGIIDTWCPGTHLYDIESERERFDREGEKWWYTCVGPSYPLANYLIETGGILPRIFDWQAEKYGVTGNLYWAANYYKNEDGTRLEDFYQTAARSVSRNGEAFLFYPGKPYGLDKPVGSLRLQYARDGIEDKELLLALREGYAKLSSACGYAFSADAVLNSMYDKLFDGMKIQTSSERFFTVRKQMLDLAEIFESDAKFAVADIKVLGNDVEFQVVVSADCTVKANGEEQTHVSSYGNGENEVNVYTLKGSRLSGDSLAVSVSMPSGEYKINLPLGGAAVQTSAEEWLENAEVLNGTAELDDDFAKISFESSIAATQRLVISGDFLNAIGNKTDEITFALKGTAGLKYSICFEYEKSALYHEIAAGTLADDSVAEITVRNIYGFPWNSGKVKKIHIYFGDKGDGARTVYVGGVNITDIG